MPIPRRVAYHVEGTAAELARLLTPGSLRMGADTEAFERGFASSVGSVHAVAVPSARYALKSLISVLGLPAGGEVILPAYTDPSMPETVRRSGLKPVFADVRPEDDNMDAGATEAAVTERTCAIVATHIFGNSCDIAAISALASKHGLVLIEDFSHSVGARYAGRYVGTFGAAGICTFNSSKFINTFGGGMLVTNDSALAEKTRSMRDSLPPQTAAGLLKAAALSFGIGVATSPSAYPAIVYPAQKLLSRNQRDMYSYYKKTYSVWKNTPREVGYTDLQSRIGLKFLSSMPESHGLRVSRSLRLDAALRPEIGRVRAVSPGEGIFWLYVLRGGSDAAEADSLQRELLGRGVDTGRGFLANAAALYEPAEKYPNTLRAVETSLQIPNHPHLSDAQIDFIASAINELI